MLKTHTKSTDIRSASLRHVAVQILKGIVKLVSLQEYGGTEENCAPDIQSARVFQRVVGRPLSLPCPLHHCNGEQVLEHYNMTTLKYDIIDDGLGHLIGYNDEGSHRCWQR